MIEEKKLYQLLIFGKNGCVFRFKIKAFTLDDADRIAGYIRNELELCSYLYKINLIEE